MLWYLLVPAFILRSMKQPNWATNKGLSVLFWSPVIKTVTGFQSQKNQLIDRFFGHKPCNLIDLKNADRFPEPSQPGLNPPLGLDYFVLHANRQKAACANKLWLVPQNVIGLDIWLFWQIKLVVRAFKNTPNRQNVGKPTCTWCHS